MENMQAWTHFLWWYDVEWPFSVTQEKPFMMLKKEGNYSGNDRYEGYAKDLADLLAEYLNINCK